MNYESFISPKDIKIGSRTFAVSRIPAFYAQQNVYPAVVESTKSLGIFGVTMLPMSVVVKMLSFTAVRQEDGKWRELDSEDVINGTFPDIADMHALLIRQTKENFGFLFDGRLLAVLGEEAEETESAL
jgi:hypothetical protein